MIQLDYGLPVQTVRAAVNVSADLNFLPTGCLIFELRMVAQEAVLVAPACWRAAVTRSWMLRSSRPTTCWPLSTVDVVQVSSRMDLPPCNLLSCGIVPRLNRPPQDRIPHFVRQGPLDSRRAEGGRRTEAAYIAAHMLEFDRVD